MAKSFLIGSRVRLGAFVAAWLIAAAGAAAQTPTAEQMEVFRNLSPEQQKAVLESFGSGTQSGMTHSDQRLETPATVKPRPTADERQRDLSPDGEPRLAAGDTLIVELEPVLFDGQERVLTERTRVVLEQGVAGSREGFNVAAATRAPPVAPAPPAPGPRIQRTTAELDRVERLIETVRRDNPYRLGRTGALDLPGLGSVPLAGLTPVQATQRLAIEPFLRDFRIRLHAVATRAHRCGRPQALRLRPVRGRAVDVCAGHGRPCAGRVRASGRAIVSKCN